MIAALRALRLGPHDELIVADNSGAERVPEADGVRVVRASAQASSYYARNEAAAAASGEWLFFTDSDCRPHADVLDRYFDQPIDRDVGAVIGEVEGVADQSALVSRYARSRGHLAQEVHWRHPYRPWGVTANLLVRRAAWESVGGFLEGIRSAGDTEFSWRLQDAGWRLDYRPQALVDHEHRESVRRLVRQAARYAAGRAWIMRRYPGSFRRPRLLRELARSAAGAAVWTATGRFERAAFKALDGLYVGSQTGAAILSNSPPAAARRQPGRVALLAGAFPDAGDPGAVAAASAEPDALVEAIRRPVRVDREAGRALRVFYAEDDGLARQLAALAWLALRRPRALSRPRLASTARRLVAAGVEDVRALHSERGGDAALLRNLVSR